MLETMIHPRCHPQGVYCTGGGFEAKINGNWTLLKADLIKNAANSVQLFLPKDLGDTPFDVERVRYAYADWPVVMVRNKDGMALPARLFDMPVTY